MKVTYVTYYIGGRLWNIIIDHMKNVDQMNNTKI